MKKILFIVFISAFIVVLALPALLAKHRHVDKRAQAAWLWNEVQRLQSLSAPSLILATNQEPAV